MTLSSSSWTTAAAEPAAPGEAATPNGQVMFLQDAVGNYLSLDWQGDLPPGVTVKDILRHQMGVFAPLELSAYQQKIQQVLNHLFPEAFQWQFRCGDVRLTLDLLMSPVPVANQLANQVVVAGRVLRMEAIAPDEQTPLAEAAPHTLDLSSHYQTLLTAIAWNIRRTLDLPTIWQQTVTGVGRSLEVERCVVCPYENAAARVQVMAEHHADEPLYSLVNSQFWILEDSYLRQAIAARQPITVQNVQVCRAEDVLIHRVRSPELPDAAVSPLADWAAPTTMLVVPTSYQDEPNGLILLYQHDRTWTDAEITFMQELADQVGTAIAHATLFAASQSLTDKLQRVNTSLMQKHRELEEARQQAEEASRLKSEFLANTSHELRTPLNGMLGFLKLVMDGMAEDPEEQKEFIEEAYRSALHLLNIINDVLDIAKIEAGKLQIDLSSVKLDELLTAVEDFTRAQVQQKGLSFSIQKPATDDEIILYGNYQRLLQVMLNLVGNAIKFTHEGGITISVEVLKKKVTVQNQELPGMVKVRVEDTGIGVSLDKQDKLFQSFSQVDGSRTRQYGGTGLGLAISQKLVEAMGGEVNFYSLGEGLGSTVTFTVPLFQEPLMITSPAKEPGGVL